MRPLSPRAVSYANPMELVCPFFDLNLVQKIIRFLEEL